MDTYEHFLKNLFGRPRWVAGSVATQRVLWTDGWRARKEDRASFNSPGLYIWGFDEQPLYLGKAQKQSLSKRFSRYIWSNRSQCNLAKEYAPELIARGVDGFPPEIHAWYAGFAGNSKVRLLGAARFAQVGIDGVWFALLPHVHPAEINAVEPALIRVMEKWNKKKRHEPTFEHSVYGGKEGSGTPPKDQTASREPGRLTDGIPLSDCTQGVSSQASGSSPGTTKAWRRPRSGSADVTGSRLTPDHERTAMK